MINARISKSFYLFAIVLVLGLFFVGAGCSKSNSDVAPQSELPAIDVSQEEQAAPVVVLPSEVIVPILVYHHVRPVTPGLSASDRQYEVTAEQFESHLKYLKGHGFVGIHLADVAAAFSDGKQLPEKPVVITFDDGRDNQYSAALPLLREYGFVATFMPFTNAIGRDGYLTWDQLAEMGDAGMEIGSHSVFHPFLNKSSDEELRRELADSRKVLQEHLGVPANVFSHPFGVFDDRIVTAVRDAGYVAARGLKHTSTQKAGDVFGLGAYIITGDLGYLKRVVGE